MNVVMRRTRDPRPDRAPILMLGTAFDTMGGISSVVKAYATTGLFSNLKIVYIATHSYGSFAHKLVVSMRALWVFTRNLLHRPALIHIHVASRASFWRKSVFFSLAILARVPYLIHLHGADFQKFYGKECGMLRRAAVRYFFERSACAIVLSESWQKWANKSFPMARIEVLYNPIVLPRTDVPKAHCPSDTILFLGRLGRRKGTYDLVDAISSLVIDFPSLRLLLAGDGELDEVRAYCALRGVDQHVEILGWISPIERSDLLASSAIYALPSYNEGLPVSVLEAMAAALPIVSTPIGGIPEAVENEVEGLLVPPGDVAALADALRKLLENSELRIAMGNAAFSKASALFSTEVVVPRLETIYASIG